VFASLISHQRGWVSATWRRAVKHREGASDNFPAVAVRE
jgi:hypothetical protein